MKTSICDLLGIDLPIVAFSHCRDVVAEVTKAGGCGVLGAALMSPEELEVEMTWLDEQVGGRPYGLDLIVPNAFAGKGTTSTEADVPAHIRDFVAGILRRHDMDPDQIPTTPMASEESLSEAYAGEMLQIALKHPLALIANALGTPPPIMLEMAREANVPVGALVGTKKHAAAQVAAGVDFIVAQGSEAGGHTGQVSTMVLVPEVVSHLKQLGSNVPVLAAGGIVTGAQIAASIAMGAAGAWTGSVWLTTHEAETAPYTKQRMLEASSADTVRSRFRTGKPSRQLRSEWHAEWEAEGSPAALPMPLMGYVSEPPLKRADVLAASGHEGAKRLSTYWVGQGVGLMNNAKSVQQVVGDMIEDYLEAIDRLNGTIE
ncbi:NAD(P)H-dependent flavin oxidoreductase [Nocardioides sp. CPCC 206347]|uniref:NAD(P)H-dependent flavin oxidoreductase n=1 Tax=unclassified Nocardioides TaxID=2615069 RepID=UPI003613A568